MIRTESRHDVSVSAEIAMLRLFQKHVKRWHLLNSPTSLRRWTPSRQLYQKPPMPQKWNKIRKWKIIFVTQNAVANERKYRLCTIVDHKGVNFDQRYEWRETELSFLCSSIKEVMHWSAFKLKTFSEIECLTSGYDVTLHQNLSSTLLTSTWCKYQYIMG